MGVGKKVGEQALEIGVMLMMVCLKIIYDRLPILKLAIRE